MASSSMRLMAQGMNLMRPAVTHSLLLNVCRLAPVTWCLQVRAMSRVKQRYTHPPYWWSKKKRERHDQEVTPENQAFVDEVILEKYGPGSAMSSPLKEAPWQRGEWTPKARRTGLIARKIGIYPMWKNDGTKILTTLLQVVDNHVIKYIPPEEYILSIYAQKKARGVAKYGCLVVGAESTDPQFFTKEYCGLFSECGLAPKKKLTRFLVSPNAAVQPGTKLHASHFRVGDIVDVYGKTIDYGFQGVVKRWGFKGGPASHGNTKTHRRPGNIGSGGEKGRVWPGQKMPGHMGSERRTLRGLQIWRINTKYDVIWVHGPAVPGPTNAYVFIHDTLLPFRKLKEAPPFPTFYPEDGEVQEERYHENLHVFSDPTITFEEKK